MYPIFLYKLNIAVTVTTKRPIVKQENTQEVQRKYSLKSLWMFKAVQNLPIMQVQVCKWCSLIHVVALGTCIAVAKNR